MCKYKTQWGWKCPFEPEPGKELCIFHLPLDQKEPKEVYKHLANYLLALYEKNQTPESKKFLEEKKPWIVSERDEKLLDHYLRFVTPGEVWDFTGFVFPHMDEPHNFMGFIFSVSANFIWAKFQNANFIWAKFHQNAYFSGAKFQNADFRWAEFHQNADFIEAKFQNADFSGAKFQNADFSGAKFQNADFREAEFQNADFSGAEFHQNADFRGAKFHQNANFSEAKFQNADFFAAEFQNADFRWTEFDGPVYFLLTEITGKTDFTGARLRNRLLFEGTKINENGLILLWDLDFVHGVSDITLRDSSASLGMTGGEKGQKEGQIVEPAGQVVFKDIEKNMNRVSFLHSEIFSDRLYIRFSNVKWEKERPERFIYDAKFVFNPKEEKWRELIKDEDLDPLCEIFNLPTGKERKVDKDWFSRLRELVTADVERIAREIRRSTEEYGSYSDAGDYYIAEMDYRRRKTPKKLFKPLLFFIAMSFYKWVSLYGESPSLALIWILGLWLVPLLIATIGGGSLNKCLNLSGYVLANMIALQYPAKELLEALNCPLFWMLHKILGISVITLFLLAIRRRFSR